METSTEARMEAAERDLIEFLCQMKGKGQKTREVQNARFTMMETTLFGITREGERNIAEGGRSLAES